jgi:hypothetical protein
MNPSERARAKRIVAAFDAEVAAARRKRNNRGDVVTLVMAKFANEAIELLREQCNPPADITGRARVIQTGR